MCVCMHMCVCTCVYAIPVLLVGRGGGTCLYTSVRVFVENDSLCMYVLFVCEVYSKVFILQKGSADCLSVCVCECLSPRHCVCMDVYHTVLYVIMFPCKRSVKTASLHVCTCICMYVTMYVCICAHVALCIHAYMQQCI